MRLGWHSHALLSLLFSTLIHTNTYKILLYRNPFHLFNHLNGAMPNLPQCAQQCPHKVLTMYFVLNNILNVLNNVLNVLNNVLIVLNNVLTVFPQCILYSTMSSGAWSNVITHTSHSSGRLKRRFCLLCFVFVFV